MIEFIAILLVALVDSAPEIYGQNYEVDLAKFYGDSFTQNRWINHQNHLEVAAEPENLFFRMSVEGTQTEKVFYVSNKYGGVHKHSFFFQEGTPLYRAVLFKTTLLISELADGLILRLGLMYSTETEQYKWLWVDMPLFGAESNADVAGDIETLITVLVPDAFPGTNTKDLNDKEINLWMKQDNFETIKYLKKGESPTKILTKWKFLSKSFIQQVKDFFELKYLLPIKAKL